MRYIVMVKQVPDAMSATTDENGHLIREGAESILDPYCETALVRTLSLRNGEDRVTAVTMGPPQAEEALRRCVELGADDAVLLTDRDFAGADTWATSRVLASFISRHAPDADLIVFGRQAIDGDTGQVPFEVAAILGVQQFAYVSSIGRDGGGFSVRQAYDGFTRESRAPAGSVVSFGDVDVGGHIPTAEGYLRGRSAKIGRLGRVDLGLGLYSVGIRGSMTRIVSIRSPASDKKRMKIEFSSPSKAAELILKELEAAR